MKRKIVLSTIFIMIITLSFILVYPEKDNKISKTENKIKKANFLSIMIEEEAGTDKYKEMDDFPESGYALNENLSKCLNGSKLKYEDRSISIKGNKSDRCYVYFDNIQVKSEFSYTGNYEEYVVPSTGTYKIELWGSSGGHSQDGFTPDGSTLKDSVGRGAYTKGNIILQKGEKLYVYVGETKAVWDVNNYVVFNGGGPGETTGGGATDVRLTVGNWDDFSSLKSRIMVAAGGGGGAYKNIEMTSDSSRGDGGALNGIDAKYLIAETWDLSGHGASQIAGGEPGSLFFGEFDPIKTSEMTGKFGKGGYGIDAHSGVGPTSSGGGGGYYGGGHGNHPGYSWTGGGGGSSFISGYPGCNAIDEKSTEDAIIHTGEPIHYSGKVFTDSEMIAGNATMPSPNGNMEEGHMGSGYAKITLID